MDPRLSWRKGRACPPHHTLSSYGLAQEGLQRGSNEEVSLEPRRWGKR